MRVTQYFTKDMFKGKTVFVTSGGSGINLGVGEAGSAHGGIIANHVFGFLHVCSPDHPSE